MLLEQYFIDARKRVCERATKSRYFLLKKTKKWRNSAIFEHLKPEYPFKMQKRVWFGIVFSSWIQIYLAIHSHTHTNAHQLDARRGSSTIIWMFDSTFYIVKRQGFLKKPLLLHERIDLVQFFWICCIIDMYVQYRLCLRKKNPRKTITITAGVRANTKWWCV